MRALVINSLNRQLRDVGERLAGGSRVGVADDLVGDTTDVIVSRPSFSAHDIPATRCR